MKAIYTMTLAALLFTLTSVHGENAEVRYHRLSRTDNADNSLPDFAALLSLQAQCRGPKIPGYVRRLVKTEKLKTGWEGTLTYNEYHYFIQTTDCACMIQDGYAVRYEINCRHE